MLHVFPSTPAVGYLAYHHQYKNHNLTIELHDFTELLVLRVMAKACLIFVSMLPEFIKTSALRQLHNRCLCTSVGIILVS